jgi:uroporphyrin-III C-methyltransferase
MIKSKVYLVGAGPGSLDLLTLRAYQLIKEADVIIYDRLVSDEIMDLVGTQTLRHYVGKQESDHTLPQEDINKLLVEYARKYKSVVRLKGGDPFVFGRGGEEVIELRKNEISFEIVPGISSSVASLTYAGIPITHRGVSNNFLVMTGHTCSQKGLEEVDWFALKNIGTIVILMGIRNREIIASNLVLAGKNKNTPVAFIEKATTKNQQVSIFNLGEVAAGLSKARSPAVFVIGEVVNFHYDWNWFLQGLEENHVAGVSLG